MDVFVKLPEDSVAEKCSIDRKRCIIEMGFGEKIAVSGVDFAIGGNAGNNAVGLARLGLKTALIGAMGDGWMDNQAKNVLKDEGVETKYIETNKNQNGFGVVINYQEERTILSYYPDALCCFPEDQELETDWVYFTSMGMNYESFYKQAVDWSVAHQAKIAFNPGTRQIKNNDIGNVLAVTQILFVNREEGNDLLKTDLECELLAKELTKLGPKIVVVTDGPNGAHCFDGQKNYFAPIIEAPVIERTGACDAFASGFMGAIMLGKTINEALVWGSKNSASVLGFVGPQKGLLTFDKINQ
ncbi:MAG: carbohydrate kinase family protein [Patescibacteria group bacterium]